MNTECDFDVTILTDRRYETLNPDDWYMAQLQAEDGLLQRSLEARGLRCIRKAWCSPDYDWSRTRAAVFRSTWDYFDRFPEFAPWLDHVSPLTQLFNSAELIRWNSDKHYLRDLSVRGVCIPPTLFLERGSDATLRESLAEAGWTEAILKPAVSGAARHTYRIHPGNVGTYETVLAELLTAEAMLLQPFQEKVMTLGEVSVMVIDGNFTHAVRKIAKAGDFRVQDDHGGTVHPHVATAEEITFAEQAVSVCPAAPLYARVDMVRDNAGQLSLMELELIEPELFFRFHPTAADTLAATIHRHLLNSTRASFGTE